MKKLYFYILLYCFSSNVIIAQNKPKITLTHQLDFGINYAIFGRSMNDWDGIGVLVTDVWHDNNVQLLKRFYQYTYLRYYFDSLNNVNIYYGYKIIFNNKYIIKISNTTYAGYSINGYNNNPNKNLMKGELAYFGFNLLDIGFGYKLKTRKINTAVFLKLSKRTGAEALHIGFNGYHDFMAYLQYNSIGFSPGFETEWFFTKNFGIGANVYYYYFPFENTKLTGDDLNDVQDIDKTFVDNYKPIESFFLINMKLAYKFSLPKIFNKK